MIRKSWVIGAGIITEDYVLATPINAMQGLPLFLISHRTYEVDIIINAFTIGETESQRVLVTCARML